MKQFFRTLGLLTIILTSSCYHVEEKAKTVINKTGEVVGKSATEFIEGVTEGVDKTLQCEIVLSQTLKSKGIQAGKFAINNDSSGGRNNILTLYMIFDQDFKGNVSAKVFDKSGVECGRTLSYIEGVAGNAKYVDFNFDKRTRIGIKSHITIE
jgi:hypothetical protein